MRNEMPSPEAPLSFHVNQTWLVAGIFGLFAALICQSPLAAVRKSEPSRLASVPEKGKSKKAKKQTGKKQDADVQWQKKQPFATTTTGKKGQSAPKKPARQSGQNIYDYQLANKYLPGGSKAWANERNTSPVSSVFIRKKNNFPSVISSTNTSFYSKDEKGSAITNTDGTGYSVGPARFSMNYEKSRDTGTKLSSFISGKTTPDPVINNDLVETRQNQHNVKLGMEYATGNGRVNASVNYVRLKDMKGATSGAATNSNNNDSADLKTFAIGYTYDVSNRTSFYGMLAHTDYEKEAMASYMRGNGSDEDGVTGVQFGMTHKF